MKDFFIKRPIAAISLSVIVLFLGVISILDLTIEQYPDITPPVVEVSATYSGADAVRVSESVAAPIAQSIMGVSDMLYMEAISGSDGTMNLQVTFAPGADADMCAVEVENNVSTATSLLPQQVVEQGAESGFVFLAFRENPRRGLVDIFVAALREVHHRLESVADVESAYVVVDLLYGVKAEAL